MALDARHDAKTIPSYSLTGDLLSYLRCGLQYRYQNGSALPPARPVQLWFGEFIHGVMEMAFGLWKTRGIPLPWPSTPIAWEERQGGKGLPDHDIGEIGRRVEAVLAVQGKVPRNGDARRAAYERAAAAINIIGPDLFPLVVFAEEPLSGSRKLTKGSVELRAERYGVTGVADVITRMSLQSVAPTNLIRTAVEGALKAQGQSVPSEYEVVVDYKGAGRPDVGYEDSDYWQQHDWQIQMYAWLRTRKPGAIPVVAGVLLYVNELLPSTGDVIQLRKQMKDGTTDIVPERGTSDYYTLTTARAGTLAGGELSAAFRQARAIRVIPVTEASMKAAGEAFDKVVVNIEERVVNEIATSDINSAWQPTCRDPDTCVACDFRFFCPCPAGKDATYRPPVPTAP